MATDNKIMLRERAREPGGRSELTRPGVQTAPGLAPAWEIYLISFSIPCFKTPNTMIRAAEMQWEEGRLKEEEANRIPLTLPPSAVTIYPEPVYSLPNEECGLKKSRLHQVNQTVIKPSKSKNCVHWLLSSEPLVCYHVVSAQASAACRVFFHTR